VPYGVGVTTDPGRVSEERQLALLVSTALDYAIVMLDPQGVVTTWNSGAERLNGYAHDEIVGRHVSVLYTEEDRRRDHPARELEIALRDGRHEEEGWRVRKDGTRFWASDVVTPVRDDDGELLGFGKVSRDLSGRRRDEQELEEFRRLVSTIRDYAIFQLDPRGIIRTWNAGAQRLKGYAPEEAIGRHFSMFYGEEDRQRDHPAHELELALRDGSYEEEGWRFRKDGTRFWASVTITALRDDEGRHTGFAKVTRDLTARRESELALERVVEELRELNAELDRFAGVAAHDLTDPLRTITGFAEVLERSDLSPTQRGYATHIKESSLRLARMLRNLLTYARAGQPADGVERVDLAAAASDVLADLAGPIAERGADVTVALPEGAGVLANAGDVRIVLQNLVSNAVKFGDAERPRVAVSAERADGWRVTVQDNGPGVDEADRERIFGAFQRAEPDGDRAGYGLGLAICQRIVERHGGAVGVEPATPRGSRFWFALPAAALDPGERPVELVR
jgi:PAS domain S-box-containing protein